MSSDSAHVDPCALQDAVRDIVVDVLMVPRDTVTMESALMADLGAESLDFLDLVFRLEDVVGKRIPADRWDRFVRRRTEGRDPSHAITVRTILEFAEEEAQSQQLP